MNANRLRFAAFLFYSMLQGPLEMCDLNHEPLGTTPWTRGTGIAVSLSEIGLN